MTRVCDIGEFGLIERIKKSVRKTNRHVLLGIGDDACLFRLTKGHVGVATVDTLVQGTHFDLGYIGYFDLGYKAMAANLSDIAAMGGKPLMALVSLTVTARQTVGELDQFYRGVQSLAGKYNTTIAGGDTVRGKELSVTIVVIGECRGQNIGLRSGVRTGDAVLVTGTLGASQAGFDMLNSKFEIRNSKLVRKHLRPEPRIREANLLAKHFKLHGMIDISDGLTSELHHLARESNVGIVIDQGALPVDPAAVAAAGLLNTDALKYCLGSGEEYELLFTLPPHQAIMARRLLNRNGCGCSIIGQAVRGGGVRMAGPDGRAKPLANLGYRHF